jgi:hypothetical protein
MAGVTRYSPEDREELLAFRRTAYSPASVFCDPAYLTWSFERAPSAQGGRYALWLYRRDGKIEAQQGAVPIALKVGTSTVAAAWNLDLFVNPTQQLRGIGTVLQDVALDETGLSLGLEVSEQARTSYLKAGWIDLGTVPLYVRPFDVRAILEVRKGISLGPFVGGMANLALRAVDHGVRALHTFGRMRAERRAQFDSQVDGLWRAVSPHYTVLALRDYESLSWRFDEFPRKDRYRIFYHWRRDELRGYSVLRVGRWDGLPAGFIVDYLCAPEDTLSVLAHAVAYFRRREVAAVYCLHRNPVSTAPLAALGFLERDSGWRFMLRGKDLYPETMDLLSDPRNWFLTRSDADVDRPREGTTFPPILHWRAGTLSPA